MSLAAESGELTKPPLTVRVVVLYHLAEDLTEALVYFCLIFSPWAFGTTEPWSIWTMRLCGYGLGLLWLGKALLRRTRPSLLPRQGGRLVPARLGDSASRKAMDSAGCGVMAGPSAIAAEKRQTPGALTRFLGLVTVCLLLFCLVAALNARATFNPASNGFEYHRCIRWLPQSLESRSSWQSWWNCLALAASFWAMRDWLLGQAIRERRPPARIPAADRTEGSAPIPLRLRRLLWILSLSGGLLGLEAILQRMANSPRLLFLVTPEIHQTAETQFGPYAYRANGAQYLNLLWPVCLGFWWTLQRSGGRSFCKHLPLASAGLMAAGPLLCGARAAALVDLGMLITLGSALLAATASHAPRNWRAKARAAGPLCGFLAGVLVFGLWAGWALLRPRLARIPSDLQLRERVYDRARLMARDYPLFGTGPGTFERVFQIYRAGPEEDWPAQLHNDWLETRITFGWLGSGLLLLALAGVMARWFLPGGLYAGPHFAWWLWISLGGCLAQARWDFPLQVYSIQFLFLAWCAVLFSLSRRQGGR